MADDRPASPGAILWDLDGTLVDSAGDIAAAANRTLAALELPPLPPVRVRGFVGDGAANLVRRCVLAAGGIPGPGQLERFLADYLEHPCDSTVVHPPALREFLAGWEGPMAVVTNKPEAITRRVLALLGIDRYFGAVVGGDTTPERKPAPGPLREALHRLGATTGVMVGDGPQDVYAGHAAGLVVVGVSWGIGVPAGADHVVNDVPALAERLRSIIMGGCVSSP